MKAAWVVVASVVGAGLSVVAVRALVRRLDGSGAAQPAPAPAANQPVNRTLIKTSPAPLAEPGTVIATPRPDPVPAPPASAGVPLKSRGLVKTFAPLSTSEAVLWDPRRLVVEVA